MKVARHLFSPRPFHGVVLLAALFTTAGGARAQAEIKLAAGPVIPAASADLVILKGVPYAAAPTGSRRWQPPQPVAPWTHPRDAGDFGSSCPQTRPPQYVTPGTAAASTDEDCLFLNVWAPKRGAGRLPVAVWIHGGGNVGGTASQTFYDGMSFARDGIVFVSFNYRLGVLGFFAHPGLAEQGRLAAANFALLDQIAALRWVHDNIFAVGGDPDNVTVMGESAGAEDILDLMCAPAARGLFAKAIVESAGMGWGSPPTLAAAAVEGGELATAFGLKGAKATANELRDVPVATILRAQQTHEPGPILDRSTLPAAPLGMFESGKAARLPLLIGTNDDEASVILQEPSMPPVPASLFPRLTSDDLAALRAIYGAAAVDDAPFSRLLIRDGFFAGPTRFVAGANSRGAPTFLYRFDYVSSVFHGRRSGASHGSEIPFIFQTGKSSQNSAADADVSAQLHGYWTSFMRTGHPVHGDTVWPAFDPERDEAIVFAEHPRVMKTPVAAALELFRNRLLDR